MCYSVCINFCHEKMKAILDETTKLILVIACCHFACAQDDTQPPITTPPATTQEPAILTLNPQSTAPPEVKKCTTTTEQLIRDGCDRRCITAVIGPSGVCPECNRDCTATVTKQAPTAAEQPSTLTTQPVEECTTTAEQLIQEGCDKGCVTAVVTNGTVCPMCRDGCPARPPTVTLPSGKHTPAVQKCTTTTEQLLQEGCDRGCITAVIRERSVCPICRDGCSDAADECHPNQPSSCGASETCLAVGVGGRYTCIDHLMEGQNCSAGMGSVDKFIYRTNLLDGIRARDMVQQGSMSETVVPCRAGLVCRRVTLTRSVCMAESGPCPTARQTNFLLQCDEDGRFQPLQCRKKTDSPTYLCQCVLPSTGVPLRGTQVELHNLADGPDCEDMVRERCQYQSSLGVLYDVRSGEEFIDLRNCMRCLCKDGEATLCEDLGEGSCSLLNPTPVYDMNCIVRGTTLANGQSMAMDCNRCACINGRLSCTRRECEQDEVGVDVYDSVPERNCRICGLLKYLPVCGIDGITYPTVCFAVTCRGLSIDELTEGSCTGRDVCRENPCEDGQVCMRIGGVTCLSREGCHPERLRRCVDLETLRCRAREGDDDGDAEENGAGAVCGRDGHTYSSVCNLIQNSTRTDVAYAGRCNSKECAGGQVCGTDGMTYDNICELRSKSANARVDYYGECIVSAGSDETVNEMCIRLRSSGRCPRLTNCRSRIRPGDGCCPVCGGTVMIGLDRDALDEYISLIPSVDTVDEVLKVLVASRFIPEDIVRRCRVAANLLRTGDLHVVLEGSDSSCAMAAKHIADRINNPSSTSTAAVSIAANPQVLQFVTVADTSPLVEDTGGSVDGALSIAAFTTAVMLLTVITLLI